ncbi:hypothetical protein YC2023_010112 [Brassica napus]
MDKTRTMRLNKKRCNLKWSARNVPMSLSSSGPLKLVSPEHSLDVSTTLLDTCDTARNLILTLREHLLNLQSLLRRQGKSIESSDQRVLSLQKEDQARD